MSKLAERFEFPKAKCYENQEKKRYCDEKRNCDDKKESVNQYKKEKRGKSNINYCISEFKY